MITAVLIVLGLCLGSFVNALVWRVRERELELGKKKPSQKYLRELSVLRGRSMCPHCKHTLTAYDLLPVISWLWLRGKCRYCRRPIAWQYPLVEALTAGLFVVSYHWWPVELTEFETAVFGLWLVLISGFMALIVYDLRWFLLPDRIVYPLTGIAAAVAAIEVLTAPDPLRALLNTILAVVVGGGVFYLLFAVSDGKWIGGGDVKLGWLLGLLVGTPAKAFLFIFIASLLGSIVSIPLLSVRRLHTRSVIPFGPFLIAGGIVTWFFGSDLLDWYWRLFINI